MAVEDTSEWHFNLQRRLGEIEALRSIYSGDGEFKMAAEEEAVLTILSAQSTFQDEDASRSDAVPVSFAISLASVRLGGQPVNVRFSMPVNYPGTQAVQVIVECSGSVKRKHHEMINKVARQTAEKLVGAEAILQVLQTVEVSGKPIHVRVVHGLERNPFNEKTG